jgi:hypothetical protein
VKALLKWLVVAAVVVVARVVAERSGAPNWLSNSLSVVVLYLLIVPIYFGIKLGAPGIHRPYLSLLGTVAVYTALVRLMVIPTYWLAYIYQWPEGRFSSSQGGVVGEGVTPLMGYLLIPFGAALAWVVGTTIIGGAIGSLFIAARRFTSRESVKSV